MKDERTGAMLAALAAAALYGLNVPLSKLLLEKVPAALMAALLYLGAGFGMLAVRLARRAMGRAGADARIARADLPFVAGMVLLDAAAPILLMMGLAGTSPANAALMGNFEIVATSLIAFLLFREHVGRKMWAAVALITASSMILSFEGAASLSFGAGSALVLMAAVAWGLENNCTRMLSLKDPTQIVAIKGLGSGAVSLGLAHLLGQGGAPLGYALAAMALGFVCYGLSIALYVLAQRTLGAARTSACYAVAPFVGVALTAIFTPTSRWSIPTATRRTSTTPIPTPDAPAPPTA